MIKNQEIFNNMKPAGFDGVFDWDFLNGCFGDTKIAPMDIDAMVERKGYVLLFETKNKSTRVPAGQRIALEELVRIGKGKIHLMIIQGKNVNSICEIEEVAWMNDKLVKYRPVKCDSDYVKMKVSNWFAFVEEMIKRKKDDTIQLEGVLATLSECEITTVKDLHFDIMTQKELFAYLSDKDNSEADKAEAKQIIVDRYNLANPKKPLVYKDN